MAAEGAPRVVGRDEELDLVRTFVAAIHAPKTLVIEGEPGIGKTTLWREGVSAARARGVNILVSRPSAVETRLSFSGISDMLAEVIDMLAIQVKIRTPRRPEQEQLDLRTPSGRRLPY